MSHLTELQDEYEFLDGDDRYRLLIDLGRTLAPMPEPLKTDATLVRGCSALGRGRAHARGQSGGVGGTGAASAGARPADRLDRPRDVVRGSLLDIGGGRRRGGGGDLARAANS